MKTSIIALSTAFAVVFLGIFFPSAALADNPSLNETGVAFTDVKLYYGEDFSAGGGSSNKALEYHDLRVTVSKNEITFHNYINIKDDRVESTEYYVEIFLIVFEHKGNDQIEVHRERTHNFDYSPPMQFDDFHFVTMEVKLTGATYHKYEVISDYDWYEIKENGEMEKLDFGPKLSEFAKVYEVEDLSDNSVETAL